MDERDLIDGMTLAEGRAIPSWPEGEEARINAGYAGHDREIVAVIEPFDLGPPIPDPVVDALRYLLPDGWQVNSRSTLIEVPPAGSAAGSRGADVDRVAAALAELGLSVASVDMDMVRREYARRHRP